MITTVNDCFAEFQLGDAVQLDLPDKSVDLVFGSPPYCDARTYGIDAQRGCEAWISWMLEVTQEACRVSRGLVLWVCGGVTRDYNYWPAPEGLLYKWWSRGRECWRPVYWYANRMPGSGGKQWLRTDIEYVLAFKEEKGPIPWANTAAMGHACGYAPGGAMSNRTADGVRRNKRSGTRLSTGRPKTGIANPGNLLHIKVGGGHLGDKEAHENEAPFPEKLAEFFIRSFCPPGGIVLDPFSGSGTTVCEAIRLKRNGIGIDIRGNQQDIAMRRLVRRQKEGRA